MKRRFLPTEIIFATTGFCNLSCSHCYVKKTTEKLDISLANSFLKSCKDTSISKVGFSGGEPLLYPEFIQEISKQAVDLDLLFGRIMTNGFWWNDTKTLTATLKGIYKSGFDGKFGLSFDYFHGQSVDKITTFCESLFDIWNDGGILEIQSVEEKNSNQKLLDLLQNLAKKLNCSLSIDSKAKGYTKLVVIKNSHIFIPVYISEQCFSSEQSALWQDKKWFKEDYCLGPGNILFVHPNGKIAPCCGFANENKKLFIGDISESFEQIIKNAENSFMVSVSHIDGLSKVRKKLEKVGVVFPGKTKNPCGFCDYICKNDFSNLLQ